MDTNVIWPVLISFGISVLLSPLVIPYLKRMKIGQKERNFEGQAVNHVGKEGTPTMGGVIFLLGIIATSLIYVKDYPQILPILFMTAAFGLLGFLDDFMKVVMKRPDGLLPAQKLIGQILITAVFAFYLINFTDIGLTMVIPFFNGKYLELGWLAIPVLFLAVIGTVNGVNLTDGVDGLASSVTVLVAVFFSVVAIGLKSGIEPITCAVVGGLLGFLLFNVHPAKVFMGDTGSLALGGFVAATAYVLRMPLFIIIIGFVYLAETLSSALQVLYFKRTKKRLFKMAPLHHHFEACGWSETRIVAVFSIVTAVLCLVAYLGL